MPKPTTSKIPIIGRAIGRIFPTILVIDEAILVKDVVSAVSTEERPVLAPASDAKTGTAVATARAPPINAGAIFFFRFINFIVKNHLSLNFFKYVNNPKICEPYYHEDGAAQGSDRD